MDSNRRDDAAAPGGSTSYGSWPQSSQPLDYPEDPAYASQAFEYPALSGTAQPNQTAVLPQQYGQQYGAYGPTAKDPEPPRRSTIPPIPSFTIPPIPVNPPTQGSQAATESVVYEVGGRGPALNVTYFDASGSLQMEFNVKLPWRKEVKLNTEQVTNAVVIAADFSHDVSCTLLVNGAQKSATSGKMATCSTLG